MIIMRTEAFETVRKTAKKASDGGYYGKEKEVSGSRGKIFI